MHAPASGRALRPRWSILAGAVLALLAGIDGAVAQVHTAPVEGITDRTPTFAVFTHARLVVKPGQVIDDGSLVVRDGVIVSAKAGHDVPAGAYEIDLGGKTVFAGFIDPLTDYAQVPEGDKPEATPKNEGPATPSPQPGARHWNPKIRPERDMAMTLKPDEHKAEFLRKLGYTDVLSVPEHGILRGQSAVLTLADTQRLNDALLKTQVAQHAAFEFSSWPASDYPGSLMGAIALLRQTFLDARWQRERLTWQGQHREAQRAEANQALAALTPVVDGQQPVFFATKDELDYARALTLRKEFGLKMVLVGNGHEYRDVARLKAANVPVILPLALPDAPSVEDPELALDASLEELEHWEWAPFNARVLSEAGVSFAFTANGVKKADEKIWGNLRKLVANGLDEGQALSALTVQPASLLGMSDKLGTLESGKLAHLVVADAELFRSDKAKIYATWIDGKRYEETDPTAPDPRGSWTLQWQGANGPTKLEVSGEGGDLSAKAGDKSFPVAAAERRVTLFVPGELFGVKRERVVVVADVNGTTLSGRGNLDDAHEFQMSGSFTPAAAKSEAAKPKPALPATAARFPAGEFGRTAPPAQQDLVLRHATVWTQGSQGVLEDADLVVSKGKIVAVGKGLKAPGGATEIDAHGKHIAPGIVDAHSHMAISHGVNEGTDAVTSEVRIGDVLDPTDMTVYRQLAGGVTSAQLLHGSANPIGGQSQIIKLRWGSDAEGLRFAAAPQTIKFALGENVKQANWGDNYTKRYPQTRLGVEQIDLDSFLAAQAYGEKLKNQKKGGEPVRRDLRLEALWEILQGQRLVQIHSYRQDEILAFARLAQRFHIVPTFQHVLEGYKVADVLKELGAGASTFSDWWAYKMEVSDAIPYNGALMTRQGVNVSFNSDSDEMGRRLNTEAAKAVKYGGLSEVEALNLVTINPAKQLHVDKYVGSLEAGKDADFVVWTANPLSSLAMPEQTYVDGRRYFDRNEDLAERARIESERDRLIAKALPERVKALAKKDDKGGKGKKDEKGENKPEWAQVDAEHLQHLLAPLRGPYHNDEPVNACTDAEGY